MGLCIYQSCANPPYYKVQYTLTLPCLFISQLIKVLCEEEVLDIPQVYTYIGRSTKLCVNVHWILNTWLHNIFMCRDEITCSILLLYSSIVSSTRRNHC